MCACVSADSAVLAVVTDPVSPRGLVCGIIPPPPAIPAAALEGSKEAPRIVRISHRSSIRPSIRPPIHTHIQTYIRPARPF